MRYNFNKRLNKKERGRHSKQINSVTSKYKFSSFHFLGLLNLHLFRYEVMTVNLSDNYTSRHWNSCTTMSMCLVHAMLKEESTEIT